MSQHWHLDNVGSEELSELDRGGPALSTKPYEPGLGQRQAETGLTRHSFASFLLILAAERRRETEQRRPPSSPTPRPSHHHPHLSAAAVGR